MSNKCDNKLENIFVDWDDTIELFEYESTGWGGFIYMGSSSYNEALINYIKSLRDKNPHYNFIICTMRGPNCSIHYQTKNSTFLLDKNLKEIKDMYGLEFSEVIYTNGACKTKFIKKYDAKILFDDNVDNISRCAILTNCEATLVRATETIIKESTFEYLLREGKVKEFIY